MNLKIGKYTVELPILCIALSYFVVLFNPLGWHMFLHVAPCYFIFLLFISKEYIVNKYRKEIVFFALFVLFAILSLIFVNTGSNKEVGKVLRYAYELIMFSTFITYNMQYKHIKFLIKCYTFSCFTIGLKMLLQRAHLANEIHRFTITNFGKIMDPNFLSALFVLPIIVYFYKCIKGGFKIARVIPLLILLFTVLATGSRGAFVSIIAGCGVIYIKENLGIKKIVTTILISTIVVIIITILPKEITARFDYHNFNDGSNSLRWNLWSTAIKIFWSNPILGRGANSMINLGTLYGARVNYMVHNTYLEILADYGIVGFGLWIVPFMNAVIKSIKKKNNLVFGILTGTYACAFFISAQDSAFLWQNTLLCYILLQFDAVALQDNYQLKTKAHDFILI